MLLKMSFPGNLNKMPPPPPGDPMPPPNKEMNFSYSNIWKFSKSQIFNLANHFFRFIRHISS